MHNSDVSSQGELPSKAKLFKSTVIAIVAAGVILVTLVLPAEFGIDPTGVGRLTGLQRMGEIKSSLAKEAAADREATLAALAEPQPEAESVGEQVAESGMKTDEMSVTLAPEESTEIKLKMSKGDTAEFTWYTDGSEVSFDLHADSAELEIKYHSYVKGKETRDSGTLEAAFDGSHGWYWRNRTESPMTITLETTGEYQAINRME